MNTSGANQFQKQPAYGDVRRLTELTRSAPLSGAPVSAQNAPRRAQKKAVRGDASAPPNSMMAPAPPPEPTYTAQQAQIWGELAALTNDPLVAEYAAVAQRQA